MSVAPATFADVPAIRGLIGRAYADDPLSRWIFPDAASRPHACAAWYGLFVEQYVDGARSSVVREDGGIAAVALWRLPEDRPLFSDGLPGIAGLLTALAGGAARAAEIGDGLHAIAGVIPAEPHAYLNFLAVQPDRRRAGLGREVLEPLFAAASAAGLFVHLETTDPANHGFYAALGFRETGRIRIGADGPEVRALRR
jgi:ribosomal protein S18 acetylase RimI-like enzyme